MIEKEKTSEAFVIASPRSTSGAIQNGVPHALPLPDALSPKSDT